MDGRVTWMDVTLAKRQRPFNDLFIPLLRLLTLPSQIFQTNMTEATLLAHASRPTEETAPSFAFRTNWQSFEIIAFVHLFQNTSDLTSGKKRNSGPAKCELYFSPPSANVDENLPVHEYNGALSGCVTGMDFPALFAMGSHSHSRDLIPSSVSITMRMARTLTLPIYGYHLPL